MSSPVAETIAHPAPDDLELAGVLHALSDPVRLRIVAALAEGDERTCGSFELPVTKSTCTHHLKVLREAGVIRQLFPGPIYFAAAFNLLFGNFAFTYLNAAGAYRRGYYDLVKYSLFSPLYWALMSAAAWKGFAQLLYRPSYWEKTVHGLARPE